MTTLRTADLYYASYLLIKNARLLKIDTGGTDGRKKFFVFTGSDLQKLALEYAGGHAQVNLRDLKSCIKHLKDIVFAEDFQPVSQ